MITLLRIVYPIFSWLVLIFFGLEAIERGLWLQVVIVAIALAGLAQTFWRSQVLRTSPHSKGDIVSFTLGALSAVVYLGLALWAGAN